MGGTRGWPRQSRRAYYQINNNGRVYLKERADQQDIDHLSGKAVGFVKRVRPSEQPFYLQVSTRASPPLILPQQVRRYVRLRKAPDLRAQRGHVSDKPSHVRNRPLLSDTKIRELDESYRKRLRGLRGVDS